MVDLSCLRQELDVIDKEIVALYKTGRDQVLSGMEYQKELLMEELAKYPTMGYTKGHFHRGVK